MKISPVQINAPRNARETAMTTTNAMFNVLRNARIIAMMIRHANARLTAKMDAMKKAHASVQMTAKMGVMKLMARANALRIAKMGVTAMGHVPVQQIVKMDVMKLVHANAHHHVRPIVMKMGSVPSNAAPKP